MLRTVVSRLIGGMETARCIVSRSSFSSSLVAKTTKVSMSSLMPINSIKPLLLNRFALVRSISTSATLHVPGHPEYIPFNSNPFIGTKEQWEEDRFLYRIHNAGPKAPHVRRHPLGHKPQMRGVVLKTLIRKPKKPNSANRKCVLLRLSNGKEATAFVPGEGHNLQEHSVVLVQKKRVRDVPGLKLRVIRGAFDCAHVTKAGK